MNVKLLRGRVIIKPVTHDYGQSKIIIPDTLKDDPRADERARGGGLSFGRGIVQAMGAPAFTTRECRNCRHRERHERGEVCYVCRGARVVPTTIESKPGFKVGDEVLFVGQHKSRDVEWDGAMCKSVAQEEVTAVVER